MHALWIFLEITAGVVVLFVLIFIAFLLWITKDGANPFQ